MHAMIKSRRQMSEAFLTAAFLSLSGGLQDAYTYISRGKVFANAQTGNIVLLSTNLCERNWPAALRYLVPLLFFAFGVAFAERIRQVFRHASHRIHWRQSVLLIEIFLLFLVGFLPEEWNILANALVSFSCAMQVQSFRKVDGHAFASTMCIGNLRSGVEALCTYLNEKDKKFLYKAAHYFGIILCFGAGAGISGLFIPILGARTIWLSCILLLVSFALMFIEAETEATEPPAPHPLP
ncbi:MAG TPA: DUF1275 domain-containing protein [Candidatus Eisenbergiella merdipullorum]|uniref:DUF1275 domain-containing protein n=1 Tax=Candidatus Eisenbergiella merdipullorum TaxID=2838553 RepID=A0A9D2IAK7_9FIRM|nr:DUF1275 domain-containing protein [Candidatus Eisenbergiella merdipullorum]